LEFPADSLHNRETGPAADDAETRLVFWAEISGKTANFRWRDTECPE
jgi:hypothetical protein